MRYLISFCLLGLLALFSISWNEPFTVKGKVRDDQGNPMVGISVQEKGTQKATVTDTGGNFTIVCSSEKAILIFSGVGLERKEIKVKGQNSLAVKMKQSVNRLEEVVVIGYGTKDDERESQYGVNPPAPPIAGNNRVTTQGTPGSVSTIRLRGVASNPKVFLDKKGKGVLQGQGYNNYQFNQNGNFNTEEYANITENEFLNANETPLSTFSIDVDAASYSNVRRFLQAGQLPPAGAVRIEELINYFHYDYPQPTGADPFSINTEIGACPWNGHHQLVLVGLQGRKIPVENLPPSNLVFLIDVSGSMMEPNKLPLVQASLKLLVDQLRPQDHVAIVVYAGNAGEVLPSTSGAQKDVIKEAIDRLEAGGSTAGGAGIQLAYSVAKRNFQAKGNNRVILCTDGDFNVGASSDDELVNLIGKEKESGVFLTIMGFGMGNYKDSKMEQLADKGNGNHAYIDNLMEARKVLVSEFGGTLFTIAKDVKLQVEFNPARVQAYRLIGYENRMLAKEDFNDDKKDAGELGSGHTVTALYEIIPVGEKNEFRPKVDPLKYQTPAQVHPIATTTEIMNIKFRYKAPDGETSKLLERALEAPVGFRLEGNTENFRFAASVAEFGLLLRNSAFRQNASYDKAFLRAQAALGKDQEGYRSEFLRLLRNAQTLAGEKNESQQEEGVGMRD